MLVWLNGTISRPEDAKISVFDRGFLYGDGVYELVRFFNGVGIGMDLHIQRLKRSLIDTGILGFDATTYETICSELLDALGTSDATVYLQVTRGVQYPRAHCPDPKLPPTVVAIAQAQEPLTAVNEPTSTEVILVPDTRRDSCNIKATSLLENVLATMRADAQGATEAVFQLNGLLTEGGSSNVFVVRGNALLTPALTSPRPILAGVMRHLIIQIATEAGIEVTEGDTTIEDLTGAHEAFITSSRRLLSPISSIDGIPLGNETPGPVTLRIFTAMRQHLEDQITQSIPD